MDDTLNIAVIGLDDQNLEMLQTVRGAERYRFHGVIPYEEIVNPESYSIEDLLHTGRQDLERIEGGPDAIIGHWDFPTTSLLPILQREMGLPGPRVEAVLACENKYDTRCEEEEAAPDLTPQFALMDPMNDAALDDPPLDYPFWIKPVVAFSGTLGFCVENRNDLRHALKQNRNGIRKFSEPFNILLQYARVGKKRALLSGSYCLAEELVSGRGCTTEGYVVNGEPHVYAVIDSMRAANGVSFIGYHYPSELPQEAQDRVIDGSCRIIRHIGLDNTAFNVEFFWNEETDEIKLLEINPRISKSHAPILNLVEGASHHEVAIDVALGREPEYPRGEGRYRHAAKFMPRSFDSARVTRAPRQADIERLQERFPDALFSSHVKTDMELTDLPNQDSYSFELGDLFLGGDSREELHENFREAMRILGYRFSSKVETNYE